MSDLLTNFRLDLSVQSVFVYLIAITGMLICFGLSQLLFELFSGRRKLQKRLMGGPEWKSKVASNYRAVSIRKSDDARHGGPAEGGPIARFERGLRQVYPGANLGRFVGLVLMLVGATYVAAAVLLKNPLLSVVAGAVAGVVPIVLVNTKRSRRRQTLDDQLPEALDFLSRILRAGHSLATGINMVAEEMPEPIASEFRQVYDQHSLGQPLEESLKDLELRVESPDFAFFVTAVLIQRQTGGDLAEVLDNISNMVRSRIRLQQHVQAITAEGRFTGYILAAFPVVLFLITYTVNPKYASVLITTSEGRMLLAGAVGLQFIGLLLIRKIVAVKL